MSSVNDHVTDGVIAVLEFVGVRFPGGDAGEIQRQAHVYRGQAKAMRTMYTQLGSTVSGLGWSGPAASAQDESWQRQAKLADQAARHLEDTAERLADHAGKAEQIVRIIVGIALELIEEIAICTALSWVTGYFADALFFARAAPLIRHVIALVHRFRLLVRSTAEAMKRGGQVAGKIGVYAEKLVIDSVPTYLRGYASAIGGNALSKGLSGKKADWDTTAETTAQGFSIDLAMYFVWGGLNTEVKAFGKLKSAVEKTFDKKVVTESAALVGTRSVPESVAPVLPDLDLGTFFPKSIAEDLGKTQMPEIRRVLEAIPDSGATTRVGSTAVTPMLTPSPSSSNLSTVTSASTASTVSTTVPVTYPAYVRATRGQAAFGTMQEFFVVSGVNAIMTAADGETDWKRYLTNMFINGTMASGRKYVFATSPIGERWAYHRQPDGAPKAVRVIANATITNGGIYALRYTVQDALKNPIFEEPVRTQLTKGDDDTLHRVLYL